MSRKAEMSPQASASRSLASRFRIRARIKFPPPVLAGLEKVEGDGLKNLDVRRQRSWLVSRFSGSFSFFKEPQSGPDCGSPFFSLGFFGEAKKSKSPAGASPGIYVKANRYKEKSYPCPSQLTKRPEAKVFHRLRNRLTTTAGLLTSSPSATVNTTCLNPKFNMSSSTAAARLRSMIRLRMKGMPKF